MEAIADRRIPVRALLLAVAASCALLLILPGQTVTTRYLSDLFLILDGAYRVAAGQIPNQDFHTPLGPLAYYLPAAGYLLSGSLGSAMPAAMALATLALSVPMLHVFGTRLHPLIAILLGAFLLLIAAVPINLGEGITALSFAKFYNRIGWVALSTLLILYLHPRQPRAKQSVLDGLCAAALTLVLIYTKATYAIAALAFLLFILTDRRQWRWALAAFGLIIVICLATEAVWQSSLSYWKDLNLALAVGGGLRGTWGQIADHILANLTDYVLLILFASLALRRSHSIRDAFFYLFCGVAGFLIINQNFQAWGIIILHAAAAVSAETILRFEEKRPSPENGLWSVAAGAKLLFLALVLPTIVHCSAALGLHMITASTRAGQAIALPHLDRIRLANLWTWGEYDAANLYLTSVMDAVKALSGQESTNLKILVLDQANPFPMVLNTPPPKGSMPWLQWDRTVNSTAYLPAEELLMDVDVIMEPKPAEAGQAESSALMGLKALYGSFIEGHFENPQETDHWRIYRRRHASDPAAQQPSAEPS